MCSPRLGTRACPFPARAQRNQPGALGVREARGLGAWGPGRPLLVGLGRGGAGAKGAPPLGARTQHPAARALEPRACPALGVPLWAPLRAALGGGVNTSSPSADAWTRRSPVPPCVSGAHALLRGPGARSRWRRARRAQWQVRTWGGTGPRLAPPSPPESLSPLHPGASHAGKGASPLPGGSRPARTFGCLLRCPRGSQGVRQGPAPARGARLPPPASQTTAVAPYLCTCPPANLPL